MWEHKVQDLVAVRNTAPRDIDRYTWLKATLSTHSSMANVISMFESNKGMYSLLQTMGAPGSVATRVDVPFDHFYAYLMDEAVKLDKANGDSKRNVRKGNKADQKGKPKGGNGNDSKDKSKQTWWLPPEKWAKMSKEEKQAHLEKKKAAKGEKGDKGNDKSSSAKPPEPTNAYQVNKAVTPAPTPTTVNEVKPAPADDFVRTLLSSQNAAGSSTPAEGTYVVNKAKSTA